VKRFWRDFLWQLVWPRRRQKTSPTLSGTVLIGLCLGLGMAAYNSASNILFVALSLLLACLILSGVLSWLNLRAVSWRVLLDPPLRAGTPTAVALDLTNSKRFVPTYALWFEFTAVAVDPAGPGRPESTLTARGIDVRAVLAKVSDADARGTVYLRDRLDAGGCARLEWRFTPPRRGVLHIRLGGAGSLFPFGFLRKTTGENVRREVRVWPAPVEYRWIAAGAARRAMGEGSLGRPGSGGDLLALRRYESGDSHRLIHWKASARSRRLLVRQFSAEHSQAYALCLPTESSMWPRPEQFELLLGLAATLAEDLFREEALDSISIDGEPPRLVRRVADLESFLDRLAEARPSGSVPSQAPARARGDRPSVLTFAPDGPRGIAAYVDGIKAAAA